MKLLEEVLFRWEKDLRSSEKDEQLFSSFMKIEKKHCSRGIDAIYAALDKMIRQFRRFSSEIACKPKCSGCCWRLISCTPAEFLLILEYLNRKPDGKKIFSDSQKRAIRILSQLNSNDSLKKNYHKPCIFLDREAETCLIYRMRPVICRVTFAKGKPCEKNRFDNAKIVFPKFAVVALKIIGDQSKAVWGRDLKRTLPEWTADPKKFLQ